MVNAVMYTPLPLLLHIVSIIYTGWLQGEGSSVPGPSRLPTVQAGGMDLS